MEKLQRQRALLHEHLRWLESEIAAEASAVPKPAESARPPAPVAPAASATSGDAPPSTPPAPEPEIPEPNIRGIHNEVRSGCLLYFGIATAILVGVLAYIYLRY